SHLLTSAMIALYARPTSQTGLAGSVTFVVVSWMFIVFVSVLVHELGHALASRAFGYQPTITLAWLGGHTHPNAPGPIPWDRDLLLTLAGPLFGLLLGLACWAAHASMDSPHPALAYLLEE